MSYTIITHHRISPSQSEWTAELHDTQAFMCDNASTTADVECEKILAPMIIIIKCEHLHKWNEKFLDPRNIVANKTNRIFHSQP